MSEFSLVKMEWYPITHIEHTQKRAVVLFGRLNRVDDFYYDYAPARREGYGGELDWLDEFGSVVNEELDATHFMILEAPK